MRSKSRDTRENQKKLYDELIQKRRADLGKKGVSPKEFTKDNTYEHLKAKQRAIMKAIAAIDESNARNERRKEPVAEQAAPAPAAPKEKKPKKEKPGKPEKTVPDKAGS